MVGISKTQTEKDLWLFDEPLDQESPIKLEAPSQKTTGTGSSVLAAVGDEQVLIPDESGENFEQDLPPARVEDEGRAIKKKVSERVVKPVLQGTRPLKARPPSDFDDLEQWDEPDAVSGTRVISGKAPVKVSPVLVEAAVQAEQASGRQVAEDEPLATTEDLLGEESPVPVRSASPSEGVVRNLVQRLSKLERILVISLALVLLVAGMLVYGFTVNRLQGSDADVTLHDLPIKGVSLTLVEADSFWRAPIREGAKAETFRRGTQLLPVVTFTVEGGPGAVRLFFRDADGALLGDVITRQIRSPGRYEVAATVGFEDIGMHSAYRTGQTEPWTVDFYEASSDTAAASAFKKLIRFPISTARR